MQKDLALDSECDAGDTPAMELLGAHSPKDFILSMRENYRRKGWSIPLKSWAERLGYKSERSLGMLLEGTRLPSTEMIERLANDYGLTDLEKRVLQLLVLEKRESHDSARTMEIQQELKTLRSQSLDKPRSLSLADYAKLFRWHVFVIRQLVATKGFREDSQWIRRRLRNKVSIDEISEAIDALVEMGGLYRDSQRQLKKTAGSLVSPDGIPSNLIRENHHEMLNRAKESISQMGVHERDLLSLVLAVDRENLPVIRKEIREFRDSINQKYAKDDANAVFQLNVQFFEHTIDVGEQSDQ